MEPLPKPHPYGFPTVRDDAARQCQGQLSATHALTGHCIKYWNGIWGTNLQCHFSATVRVSDQSIQWDKALAVRICSGRTSAWMFRVSCLSSAPSSVTIRPTRRISELDGSRISIHDAFQLLAQQSLARGATYRYSMHHLHSGITMSILVLYRRMIVVGLERLGSVRRSSFLNEKDVLSHTDARGASPEILTPDVDNAMTAGKPHRPRIRENMDTLRELEGVSCAPPRWWT